MGFLSDAWKGAKDAVSSGWDSVKDAVTDVTGVDSLNTLLLTGGLAMAPAQLAGKGIFGEALNDALSPLLMPPGGTAPQGAMSGPLNQAAPAMSMGTGATPRPETVTPNLANLLGPSGNSYGPTTTSAALLQSNPDAYQFAPLIS